MLSQEQKTQYDRDGYMLARALFSSAEAAALREHYMELRAAGRYPGDTAGVGGSETDPLKRYPRMIHMHRWDERSLRWLIDARIAGCMRDLLGADPYAVQTMLYFKPPGARGQALHQDQFYLRAQPGTCMAAWMALDDCDEENGCMRLAPGTQNLPLLCAEKADLEESFTDVTVPVPLGMEVRPVEMAAGDVLFFNGSVIHGSYRNRSENRFRRALIGHYVLAEAQAVAKYYHPALRMDGSEIPLAVSEGGGPCGVWVSAGGRPEVELVAP